MAPLRRQGDRDAPVISYELAQARSADLRRRGQRDASARAAAPVPSGAPQLSGNQIPVSHRRAGRRRRFGVQLWTLLHAQALLDGPATAVPGRGSGEAEPS